MALGGAVGTVPSARWPVTLTVAAGLQKRDHYAETIGSSRQIAHRFTIRLVFDRKRRPHWSAFLKLNTPQKYWWLVSCTFFQALNLFRCYISTRQRTRGASCPNSIKKRYADKPLHDFSSHAADAVRYLAIIADQERDQRRITRVESSFTADGSNDVTGVYGEEDPEDLAAQWSGRRRDSGPTGYDERQHDRMWQGSWEDARGKALRRKQIW